MCKWRVHGNQVKSFSSEAGWPTAPSLSRPSCTLSSSSPLGRYAKSLVVDLAFVIEAQTADELPEQVLGGARLCHISLDDASIPALAPANLAMDEV